MAKTAHILTVSRPATRSRASIGTRTLGFAPITRRDDRRRVSGGQHLVRAAAASRDACGRNAPNGLARLLDGDHRRRGRLRH